MVQSENLFLRKHNKKTSKYISIILENIKKCNITDSMNAYMKNAIENAQSDMIFTAHITYADLPIRQFGVSWLGWLSWLGWY